MRKHCCVLFSACPRAQAVPQQLGMEAGNQHQGLLREAGCTDPYSWMGLSPRSCQWWIDSAGNNHSDSNKAWGTGSVLCLSLRWRVQHRKPFLESCRGAGSAAFGGHCKHAIGQEDTREWSRIYEIQLGLTDKIAFCDELCPVGSGREVTVQGSFQHHLIILGKEVVEELINSSNTMWGIVWGPLVQKECWGNKVQQRAVRMILDLGDMVTRRGRKSWNILI